MSLHSRGKRWGYEVLSTVWGSKGVTWFDHKLFLIRIIGQIFVKPTDRNKGWPIVLIYEKQQNASNFSFLYFILFVYRHIKKLHNAPLSRNNKKFLVLWMQHLKARMHWLASQVRFVVLHENYTLIYCSWLIKRTCVWSCICLLCVLHCAAGQNSLYSTMKPWTSKRLMIREQNFHDLLIYEVFSAWSLWAVSG